MAWEFDFDVNKDKVLRDLRGIGFEDIISLIAEGGLLDVVEHPNQSRYPGQQIFVVDVDGYVYLVPFETRDTVFFLRTIFASRKATKIYIKENKS